MYRVADAGGFCVEVTPAGSKLWRWRWPGKAFLLPLGDHPVATLVNARRARNDARVLLNAGANPTAAEP